MPDYIVGGFAKALNKLASNQLDDTLTFSVPQKQVPRFQCLLRNALNGEFIESAPGGTYEFLTGTDVTISTAPRPDDGDILFPAHRPTLEYFLGVKSEDETDPAADSMLEQKYEDKNGCSYSDDETVDPQEDMDGDHTSGLASAGFGTDGDYEHNYDSGDDDAYAYEQDR